MPLSSVGVALRTSLGRLDEHLAASAQYAPSSHAYTIVATAGIYSSKTNLRNLQG